MQTDHIMSSANTFGPAIVDNAVHDEKFLLRVRIEIRQSLLLDNGSTTRLLTMRSSTSYMLVRNGKLTRPGMPGAPRMQMPFGTPGKVRDLSGSFPCRSIKLLLACPALRIVIANEGKQVRRPGNNPRRK